MKIALAFSGGGIRATVFHLGVLAHLAHRDLLRHVSIISTVSGGSLAAGLVFSLSRNRWPRRAEYLYEVIPEIHTLLTTRNLQWSYAMSSLMFPWRLLGGRAAVLGAELERQWHISGRLADLPQKPRWIINATSYQTGKNWRFQRDLMGDYQTGYVTDPDFRLSRALAASAAVPGLIGPLVVKTRRYNWTEYRDKKWQLTRPRHRRIHLWDGGVYDNLGVEPLFKPGSGLRDEADFLIVCDASRPVGVESRGRRWSPNVLKTPMRLVDVAMDQVRSLRARMVIDHFKQNPGTGTYLKIGRQTRTGDSHSVGPATLAESEVHDASHLETTLRRLTDVEFNLVYRHGFEVADRALSTHGMTLLQPASSNFELRRAA